MTLGIGSGYGMSMIGGMNSTMGTANVPQYFKQKYGCEDCFRARPYLQEYPKPLVPLAKESMETSFWQRLKKHIFG